MPDVNTFLEFFEKGRMDIDFAIAKLFAKVIQPTPNKVSVVTTNYDRIVFWLKKG